MSNFNQLCVWEGTIVADDGSNTPDTASIRSFESWMKEEFGVDVKYEATVTTLPDKDKNGEEVLGTGGRSDLFFYIADGDIDVFSVPRLSYGIRWWEDVLDNGGESIYPSEFLENHPYNWKK